MDFFFNLNFLTPYSPLLAGIKDRLNVLMHWALNTSPVFGWFRSSTVTRGTQITGIYIVSTRLYRVLYLYFINGMLLHFKLQGSLGSRIVYILHTITL